MLFQEQKLLVISDDDEFLEVVRALPYEYEVLSDLEALLNRIRYSGIRIVLFDVTTTGINADMVFHALSDVGYLIVIGTQSTMDLITRYLNLQSKYRANYVFKPILPTLLKRTIENTYSGRELVEFIGIIAAESKQSTATITGFSHVLIHRELEEAQRIYALERIYTTARRWENLVTDYATVIRLERGDISFAFSVYLPYQTIQLALEPIKKQITDRHHTLTISIASDCPKMLVDTYWLNFTIRG